MPPPKYFVRRLGRVLPALVLLWIVAAAALGYAGKAHAANIPPAAHKYRADLTRNARLAWGLDAPVATLAAQVHQESGWRPDAVSRVGAKGLAQFMPTTANWISGIAPELASRQPENPAWSLRALATYDKWLWDRVQADSACDRMAMALSAYNGGLGWLLKDKAAAQAAGASRNRWWGEVERFNGGRSVAAFSENRGYPVRIIKALQPAYAGWGPGVCA